MPQYYPVRRPPATTIDMSPLLLVLIKKKKSLSSSLHLLGTEANLLSRELPTHPCILYYASLSHTHEITFTYVCAHMTNGVRVEFPRRCGTLDIVWCNTDREISSRHKLRVIAAPPSPPKQIKDIVGGLFYVNICLEGTSQ